MEHPNNLIDSFTGIFNYSLNRDIGNNSTSATSTSTIEANETIGKVGILPINIILRGCVLRSTEWMVGIVVNTGHDVKIMQSKIDTKIKASNLDYKATSQIKGIIIMLLWVCLCGSIGQIIFNKAINIENHWYLDWEDLNIGQTWIIMFFYLLLLHASMIPVSLYVSMAIIRFIQSKFINYDLNMYYELLDIPAIVRTMTLNEELGQISHIFSDKTGTLTCNNMNFRKVSINGVIYGQGITEIGRAAWKLLGKPVPIDVEQAEKYAQECTIPHVSFYDPNFYNDYGRQNPNIKHNSNTSNSNRSISGSGRTKLIGNKIQKEKISEFYRYLSLCHEVIPERLESGEIKLSAPNPDDEALVCAATYFGYEFKDRNDKICIIYDSYNHNTIEIEVLYIIPFTSKRKKMSIIIRDIDGVIKLITKGADNIIFALCNNTTSTSSSISVNNTTTSNSTNSNKNTTTTIPTSNTELLNKTEADINQFSIEGLRCLVLAYKTIDFTTFQQWKIQYDKANTNLIELEKRKNNEMNQIEILENEIENNLIVLGATGIEDRLQDNVPVCIEKLVQASIKIWILTGDKEETAINIAVACNLVLPTQYMKQIIINKNTASNIEITKEIFEKEIKVRVLSFVFILIYALYMYFIYT